MALIALAGATIAIYEYAPQVFVGHKPVPQPSVSAAPTPTRAATCRLALVVTDAPARSEVLLRVGQAPVDVDQMPVGARLELVATAEGYAPRRAVIAGRVGLGQGRRRQAADRDPDPARPVASEARDRRSVAGRRAFERGRRLRCARHGARRLERPRRGDLADGRPRPRSAHGAEVRRRRRRPHRVAGARLASANAFTSATRKSPPPPPTPRATRPSPSAPPSKPSARIARGALGVRC